KQDLENARRSVTYSTRQAFLGVTSGVAQVKALAQALVSNQTSLASTKLGQEVGVRTEVDVLNAQQQLYSAKRDLAQARYNFILSQLRLKSAAGQISEDDLAEINRWLR
ncbi:MAG: TolC family protein, partial [Burkholderiales bacterium]